MGRVTKTRATHGASHTVTSCPIFVTCGVGPVAHTHVQRSRHTHHCASGLNPSPPTHTAATHHVRATAHTRTCSTIMLSWSLHLPREPPFLCWSNGSRSWSACNCTPRRLLLSHLRQIATSITKSRCLPRNYNRCQRYHKASCNMSPYLFKNRTRKFSSLFPPLYSPQRAQDKPPRESDSTWNSLTSSKLS